MFAMQKLMTVPEEVRDREWVDPVSQVLSPAAS